MFRNILVPVDGSAAALAAVQKIAEAIALWNGAHVTAVVVIAPLSEEHTEYEATTVHSLNERMVVEAQRALCLTQDIFLKQGVECTTQILRGDPVSTVLATEAERGGYDLIALGSRRIGTRRDDVKPIGSVTERLLRYVSTPVLVFPAGAS